MVWQAQNRLEAAEPAGPLLDKKLKAQIAEVFASYPSKRAALLGSLHLVQDQLGHLPDAALVEVARLLEISPAEVLDTAGFYDMYTRPRRGQHLIGVCASLSCELCGGEELLKALKDKLGIEPGQTTADEKFTLITMQCLGACDFAPAMLVDDKLHKTVTIEQLDKILESY